MFEAECTEETNWDDPVIFFDIMCRCKKKLFYSSVAGVGSLHTAVNRTQRELSS